MKKNILLKNLGVIILCLFSIFINEKVDALTVTSNSPLYAFTYDGNRLKVIYNIKDNDGDVYCMQGSKGLPAPGDVLTKVGESKNSAAILYILDKAKDLKMKTYTADGESYTYTNEEWADLATVSSEITDEINGLQNSKQEGSGLYIKQQLAIWLLEEEKINQNNAPTELITDLVKTTYPGLEKLVADAKVENTKQTNSTVKVTFTGETNFVYKNNKYETGEITVSSSSNKPINLSLSPALADIYYDNGQPVKGAIASGSKIKLVVAADDVSVGETTIELKGTTTGTKKVVNVYEIDSIKQQIGKVEETSISGSGQKNFKLVKKVVQISKTDITTSKELPGATLQIEDKDGNIVKFCKDEKGNDIECKWVSQRQPYKIEGMPNGTYYLVETIAPKGYVLNQERVEFVVDDSNYWLKVKMENNLEVEVPDTLSSRTILLITIGMFNIALGIGILLYVKKNKVSQ